MNWTGRVNILPPTNNYFFDIYLPNKFCNV